MKTKILSALLVLVLLLSLAPVQPAAATEGSTVSRIAGSNRYGTAVEISVNGWTQSDYVVLARGDEFADALAGVPLASYHRAPILLTNPNRLPNATKEELERLEAKTVIILGGDGAVSPAVEKILTDDLGLTVKRIAGANRYATAGRIAQELYDVGYVYGVFVANGRDFPDALAASVYACGHRYAIILVEPNRIPPGAQEALTALNPSQSFVIGGEGVISQEVFNALPHPERIAGANRYATATALAERFRPGAQKCFVATGLDFADAIAGGVLAAKEGGILLLVSKTVPPTVRSYVEESTLNQAIIFGGQGAVSDETAAGIEEALPYSWIDYFYFDSETGTITGYDPAGGSDVVIPATIGGVPVKHIGENAFEKLGITSVVLPDGLETIGDSAFWVNSLSSLVIPDTVTALGTDAFGHNIIGSLVIPDSVVTMGKYAFASNRITSLKLSSNLEVISDSAFSYNKITSVEIPDGVKNIGHSAFWTNEITTLAIPDSVIKIESFAFSSNRLTSLDLGNSVETIGWSTFANNKLTSLVIPVSMREIQNFAFGNNELTSITIGDEVSIGDNLLTYENNYFRDAYYADGAGAYSGTQEGTWSKQ